MTSSKDRPKIIFIDDEESILSAFRRLLRREPYDVLVTSSPEQVFDWVKQNTISVVISDQRMPVMEGVAVLSRVRELSPDTVRVMLTGYADMQAAVDAINNGNVYRFLAKPWNEIELKGAIKQAEEQFSLILENRRLQTLTIHQNDQLFRMNEELEKRVDARTQEVQSLNQKLEQSFLECVKVMGGLVEYSGSLPAGHPKRVARLAGEMARHLKLPTKEAFDIQVAGYLHDIGKIGLKTDEMKEHPVRGARITGLVPTLGTVSKIILHHHERPDGKGYPAGLKADAIPLGSMLISLADAYDQLLYVSETTDVNTPQNAVQALMARAVEEFTPDALQALREVLESRGEFSSEHSEKEIDLYDLREGMVTAKPIFFQDGRQVIGANERLNSEILSRLWKKHLTTPVTNEVFVYRKRSS